MFVAAAILLAKRSTLSPTAPLYKYCLVSLSNVVATTCQYEARMPLHYPLQPFLAAAFALPVFKFRSVANGNTYVAVTPPHSEVLLSPTRASAC